MIPKPPHPEPPPLSRETEAELRKLFARWATADANIDNWQTRHVREAVAAARTHLPALLDQIASDRDMREEAAKMLEQAREWTGYPLQSDQDYEDLCRVDSEIDALLAKLHTAVPAEERQS